MTARVPLSVPHLAGNELTYLENCVRSNFVSSVGPYVQRFEDEFAAQVGSRHAVACASGTAALHVALVVTGVSIGAEVAVATFTFVASVNAVSYTGAAPLLVDSERQTWNFDGERLYDEVVARAARGEALPAAVEAVHILGHPADLEPVLRLRERFGIRIIEDAAEALGASYAGGPLDGRQVGSIGDIGCYSFNGNKILTTGGGGMLVTDDPELAQAARHLTTHAKLPGPSYVHDRIGFNYRMSNVSAAIGLAQLEQLRPFLEAKRSIARRYDEALSGRQGIEVPPARAWAVPTNWLYSILLSNEGERDQVRRALDAAGIEARPVWVPAHLLKPYRSARRLGGDVAADLSRRGLSLPSSVGLTVEDQNRVIDALLAALDKGDAGGKSVLIREEPAR